MRNAFIIGLLLMVQGCMTSNKGGSATIGKGEITGTLNQSENPESKSIMEYERVENEGGKLTSERITTEIGASQSMADILKSAGANKRAIALSLVGIVFIGIGGFIAFKGYWIGGAAMAGSGVLALFVAEYGVFILVIGLLVAVGVKLLLDKYGNLYPDIYREKKAKS